MSLEADRNLIPADSRCQGAMRITRPKRFNDDGTNVTVDLHGCSVRDGMHIVRRCAQEAHRRGRARVEVIHGQSTSLQSQDARTLRNALHRALATGEYSPWISGHVESASGGSTTLWLHLGQNSDPIRIREQDILPPA